MNDAFVYDAVRTPFGRFGGALATTRPDDLAALVVRTIVERAPGLRATAQPNTSTRSSSATPTVPVRTTATSRAWRPCSPACRPRSPARPSTGSAGRVSTRR